MSALETPMAEDTEAGFGSPEIYIMIKARLSELGYFDAAIDDRWDAQIEQAMLRYAECDVIGCHPLFGPEVPSLDGYSFVICPARSEKGTWLAWLRTLLERNGAQLVETTPEEHDRFMSIVQGLNHFNTMTFGMVMEALGTDLEALKPFMTPIFEEKIRVIREVFLHNARMYSEILTRNPYLPDILEQYEKTMRELKHLIEVRDAPALQKRLQDAGVRFPEIVKKNLQM